MAHRKHARDDDAAKGATEQDRRTQHTNTSLSGQLPHRKKSPLAEGRDSDFPEPGENPEHTGQLQRRRQYDREFDPEGEVQDQDPGHRQKQNQNRRKDDSLAS